MDGRDRWASLRASRDQPPRLLRTTAGCIGERKLRALTLAQAGLWTFEGWQSRPGHRRLVELCHEAGVPGHLKAVHDAALWSQLLAYSPAFAHDGDVVELLPGASPTLPLALAASRFAGRFVRVDAAPLFPLHDAFTLDEQALCTDVFHWRPRFDGAVTVVANHVIDDLMLWLWEPSASRRDAIVTSPEVGRRAWAELSASPTVKRSAELIGGWLAAFVTSLPGGSRLLLRHYVCATALYAHDLPRVHAETQVFQRVLRVLMGTAGARLTLPDLGGMPVPCAGRLPGSVAVVERVVRAAS